RDAPRAACGSPSRPAPARRETAARSAWAWSKTDRWACSLHTSRRRCVPDTATSVDRREHQEALRHEARRQHHVVDVLVIELGAMAAGKVVGDVGRGEEECGVAEAHGSVAREGGGGQCARVAYIGDGGRPWGGEAARRC